MFYFLYLRESGYFATIGFVGKTKEAVMSQTTQFVSFPNYEGEHEVRMSATAWGAKVEKKDNGEFRLAVGPDMVGARNVLRRVIVQAAGKKGPEGFQNAGIFTSGNKKLRALVEFPQ